VDALVDALVPGVATRESTGASATQDGRGC
jgi:hypothetical protein